jgi:hypothetical protein
MFRNDGRIIRRFKRLVRVPEHEIAAAVGAPEVVDRAVPGLTFARRVGWNHVERDRRIPAEDIVFKQEGFYFSACQHRQLALPNLTEIRRWDSTVHGPLVVLPWLEGVSAGVVGVLAHRLSSTRASRPKNHRLRQLGNVTRVASAGCATVRRVVERSTPEGRRQPRREPSPRAPPPRTLPIPQR